jgi:hypothetical protein
MRHFPFSATTRARREAEPGILVQKHGIVIPCLIRSFFVILIHWRRHSSTSPKVLYCIRHLRWERFRFDASVRYDIEIDSKMRAVRGHIGMIGRACISQVNFSTVT